MPALITRRTPTSKDSAPATSSQASSSVDSSGNWVRLHISPFNLDLLPRIIPPSLQSEARNISFHQTLVSPERGFGYIELPPMAADKLKKKLNGSILKGEKVKVHNAKPQRPWGNSEPDVHVEVEQPAEPEHPQRKKRKITEKVEAGVELPEGRTVKRGWTESVAEKRHKRDRTAEEKQARKEKKERKREASKYTAEPELMFKAKLEPTATMRISSKHKKSSDSAANKDKKAKKTKDEVIIHEFANTKKYAGFLRENQVTGDSSTTAEYVDGQGWVDVAGNIIEAERPSKRKKSKKSAVDLVPSLEATSIAEEEDAAPAADTAVLSSESEPAKPAVHPLEALYKRAKEPKPRSDSTTTSPKKPPPIDTSKAAFSFFDASSDVEDDEGGEPRRGDHDTHLPPMTPKTKHDYQMRGLRSAAPEPDTATHERHFPFSEALDRIGEDEEDEEDKESVDGEEDSTDTKQPRPESEFRKWFYEHRGENNRAWRQKRRDAMKLKRQRENRRLARRMVV